MSLRARIFLYIIIIAVFSSVIQMFFISNTYNNFQQKLGQHKNVVTEMLVSGIENTIGNLKIEASLLSCPYNIGKLLQNNDNSALMKWENRMRKQGKDVVFVYANGSVVSINSNFIDSEVFKVAEFFKTIMQDENHFGLFKIGNIMYMACGEPIKAVDGVYLGVVVVFQPVTPQFLATIADDRQIVQLRLGNDIVQNRPAVPDSSPFERVAVQIDGIGADDGFYLAFLPNELLISLVELQKKFVVGVPILAILSSLILVYVIHVLLKPYSRTLVYMRKYSGYEITLKEMRDGIFATNSGNNPDLMKFKIVLLRMIDTIMAHLESIGSHALRLEEMTKKDALTGLLNRSGIDAELQASFEMCKESELPLSILIVDIDRFKSVNDTLGHLGGDTVLCRVANALSDPMRKCDAVGRWGGEEFLIVCRGLEADLAQALAGNLRTAVHSIELSADAHVTISIGVAQLLPNETLESLLGRADAALYRAKTAGRDCVVVG